MGGDMDFITEARVQVEDSDVSVMICLLLWETTTTTVLQPFFPGHPGEPVPEENFWTLWHKGRLTEADTLTIRLGATPSGLTSTHLCHPPIFFTGRMPFLPPSKQCQSTEGNAYYYYKTKLESVSLSCKSHRSKTANIKFLSANSTHRC